MQRKTIVKLRMKTSADLTDPNIRDQVQQQVRTALFFFFLQLFTIQTTANSFFLNLAGNISKKSGLICREAAVEACQVWKSTTGRYRSWIMTTSDLYGVRFCFIHMLKNFWNQLHMKSYIYLDISFSVDSFSIWVFKQAKNNNMG